MGDEDSTKTLAGEPPLRFGPRLTAVLSGIERFTILKKLGEGGMGTVFAAYDSALDRRVAVKLVRPDRRGADDPVPPREQLLREAQAMARLSHPNVVAIHEVGEIGDDVFVVLELVDGTTLKEWIAERPRTWREVVAAYVQAGRGLAAAHEAGLVHRDFKPHNVLVRRDGRIQVTDFGVVSMGGGSPDSSTSDSGGGPSSHLTFAGRRVGTPAYMAPEQYAGAPVDGRADQFAFCVSLWEGLYGKRPFEGKGTGLAAAMAQGQIGAPPTNTNVPRWLEAVLRRGLSPSPEARFASMGELLSVLERDPARDRRRRVIAAGAIAVVGALAVAAWVGWTRRSTAQPCEGLDSALAGKWDAGRAAAVRDAFAHSGLPFAPAAAGRITAQLDAWTKQWTAMRVDACRATHVRGVQSEALLDARVRCLDRELDEVGQLAGALTTSDRDVIARAAEAPSLPDVATCADRDEVMLRMPPPSNPAVRDRVTALEHELAGVRAGERTGRYKEARARATILAANAGTVGFAPLVAETLLARGELEEQDGDLPAAMKTLVDAAHAAGVARDDTTSARALLALVGVHVEKGDASAALALAVAADSAVERARDPDLAAALAVQLGMAHDAAGDDQAQAFLERALTLRKAQGTTSVAVAEVLNKLGGLASRHGDNAGARSDYEAALAIVTEQLGREHPATAITHANLCYLDAQAGKLAEARACQEDVLGVLERALGAEHPQVAWALNEVALVQREQGDLTGAAARFERALDIWQRASGPDHPDVAWPLINLGEIAIGRGDSARGDELCTRALAILEKASGSAHPDLVEPLTCMASAKLSRSRADALALAHRAHDIAVAHRIPEDPELTRILSR